MCVRFHIRCEISGCIMEAMKENIDKLKEISRLIRYWILLSTTKAGSGHPTSSLSAVELMVGLMFSEIFKFDLENPKNPNNDHLIFSKGHASPLLYSLYAAAGAIDEQRLRSLRKFTSPLEGHPTPKFPFIEAATGSLGQGLSIGVGMALNAKYLDKMPYKTYVLLGDSEMSEGSIWEAIQIASYYKLNNLIGIVDINRLGQTGETMYGHDLDAYKNRLQAFGWNAIVVRGHDLINIVDAYKKCLDQKEKPSMILAKTIKGKGISFLEDRLGWHGKTLSEKEFKKAKKELGDINFDIRGQVKIPENNKPTPLPLSLKVKEKISQSKLGQMISTRKAFGLALARLGTENPKLVTLDAEMKNSTYTEIFESYFPKRFFQMYIAEQNMVSVALGLSIMGKVPFIATFAAFFTRAYDQIRMAQYSNANIKFVGSHVGVSIGQDGPSQMGLEDISMFRSIHDSVVLYPSDAVSCEKLVEEAAKHFGIVYIRTTRKDTPVIYAKNQSFPIGGSKVIKKSKNDRVTLIGTGITLHQALIAYKKLKKSNITVRIIDLYSIKPIDKQTLKKAARETQKILVVEDHHPEGGIAEAVRSALYKEKMQIHSLAVRRREMSGKPEELLDYEDIHHEDIVRKVKLMLNRV